MQKPYGYDNPAKFVEHHEWKVKSCGGCHHHQPVKQGYECKMSRPAYPLADRKTCIYFMPRGRK